ncbi:MAG TPA: AAA family ATPase, partial [Polyangiaceae bacterium]
MPNDLVELALWMLEPDPARRPRGEVIARLVGIDESVSRVQRLCPEFIGRGVELERLSAAFTRARQSRARVVHVHGESGIGKTSLLRRFAAVIEEREGVVLRGACYRDASVPYKALDAVMDRIALRSANIELPVDAEDRAALALMFPIFSAGEGSDLALAERDPLLIRARAVSAFRKLLAQLAAQRGVVLCIDDMQWTDLESIELLSTLLHPPAAPGLLLVLGYRSAHADWGPRVEVLRKELPPDDDLPLGPLDVQAVRALIESSVVVSAPEVEAISRESGGNPFLLGELVRGRSAGHKAISFGAVLASRVSALSPKYLPYLELVCVASRPVDEQVLRRALGVTQETLLEARWVLVADSLVRVAEEREGRSVEPYHDRIREHLLCGLEPERLRARHSALAEAYEAEAAVDPEILGFHYRAAGNAAKALTYTERAADAAAHALAFDRAADLYQAALGFVAGDVRVALLVKHGDALANAGRCVEAARTFAAALEHGENAPQLKLRAGEDDRKAGSMARAPAFSAEQIAVRASEA